VEFGLAFALFWTPLVRRLAALAFITLLTAATFDFGKVDGVGHLLVIAVLLVVLADPGRQHPGCRPMVAPLVSSAAWLATILLYTGGHALYYRSQSSALLSLAGSAVLLGFIFFCVQNRVQVSSRTTARRPRPPYIDITSVRTGAMRGESLRGSSGAIVRANWPDLGRERRSEDTAAGFTV
jgi:hypothetical protein